MTRFWWPSTRRRGLLLALIIALGLALRLALWWHTPIHQPANDEVEYLAVARDLVEGRGWVFYETYHWLRAPLYPLWLAASLWLAGGELRWSALPNIALSAITIYLFYLLGREVGRQRSGVGRPGDRETRRPGDAETESTHRWSVVSGQEADPSKIPYSEERVGLIAAAASAILLPFATFASLWMAETLFNALFVAALVALLRYGSRPRLALAVAAGVLLGLAILTRSMPLTALPFAGLWALGVGYRRSSAQSKIRDLRSKMLYASAFVLAAALTIAPWTIRNYGAYGGLIPVETGLSFNLWLFNEPREDMETIFATLESIPNPVARSDYATHRGLERLREDPSILARKLWPNWNYLWRIRQIEDRFLQPTYYQDVGIGRFVLAIALDDALYVTIAVLGFAGLIVAPLDRRKVLLGGWTLYAVATILLTHGETRYRQFFFPVLIPYAAWLLVALRESPRRLRESRLWIALAITIALLWGPLVASYPRDWAVRNLGRGWAVWRAEQAVWRGDHETAIALYRDAGRHDPRSADTRIGLARVLLDRGRVDEAITALEQGWGYMPSYARLNVWRGEAYRRAGRLAEAREAFRGFYNFEQQMLDEAWNELDPPLPLAVDVGGGLDFGLVGGVYPAETQADQTVRWSGARVELRLAGTTRGGSARLTLSAPRPDRSDVSATICANERCARVMLDERWRTVVVYAPPGGETRVTVEAATFQPRTFDPASPDERELGVLLDHVALRPLGAP